MKLDKNLKTNKNLSNSTSCIAIDLGTTNSVFGAVGENGEMFTLKNMDGDGHTPSYVWVKENSDTKQIEFCVGQKAKDLMMENPEDVLSSYKPKMGTNETVKVIKFRSFTPELCSAAVLDYIRKSAEKELGTLVDKAVITVPAYFDDNQKGSTKRASQMAGMDVIKLVAEPTAAGYYYGKINKDDKVSKNILAYDLGGGTFDTSILASLTSDNIIVQRVGGDKHLGGDDIDKALAYKIMEKSGLSKEGVSQALLEKFIRRTEIAKIKLTNDYHDGKMNSRCKIDLPKNIGIDKDTCMLSMKEFLQVIKPYIDRTLEITKETILDANVEIDEVLLIGGSSRLPLIREGLIELLDKDKFNMDYFMDYLVDPDMAVAYGARLILKDYLNDVDTDITDVVGLPIGVELENNEFNPIIVAGSPLPSKGMFKFTNPRDGQSLVKFGIYEGKFKQANKNHLLGTIEVPIKPCLKGQLDGFITLRVNDEGIISGRCSVDGKIIKIKLNRYYDEVTDTLDNIKSNSELSKATTSLMFGK